MMTRAFKPGAVRSARLSSPAVPESQAFVPPPAEMPSMAALSRAWSLVKVWSVIQLLAKLMDSVMSFVRMSETKSLAATFRSRIFWPLMLPLRSRLSTTLAWLTSWPPNSLRSMTRAVWYASVVPVSRSSTTNCDLTAPVMSASPSCRPNRAFEPAGTPSGDGNVWARSPLQPPNSTARAARATSTRMGLCVFMYAAPFL